MRVKQWFKHGKKFIGALGTSLLPSGGPNIKVNGKLDPRNFGRFAVGAHLAGGRVMRKERQLMFRNPQSGVSTRVPYARIRGGNSNRVRGLKKVRVPRKLRKQILAVAEKSHVQGYMQETYLATQTSVAPVSNLTTVFENVYLPNDSYGGVFSYNHVLHCASRLWNAKSANSTPQIGDSANFDPKTCEIHVRKQWVTLRMKNNSLRTLRVRIVTATPHGTKTLETPVSAWDSAFVADVANGTVISNSSAYKSAIMYTHPKIHDGFRNQFGTSETDYTLEPGQAIEQNIPGPGMIYRGGKFYQQGNTYNVFQKQDVFNFAVILPDLGVCATGETGHLSDTNHNLASNFLCFDATYHVSMSMPEPVGWQSGGVAPAAGPVANVNRVRRVVLDDFNSRVLVADAAEYRTDEQNPIPA